MYVVKHQEPIYLLLIAAGWWAGVGVWSQGPSHSLRCGLSWCSLQPRPGHTAPATIYYVVVSVAR